MMKMRELRNELNAETIYGETELPIITNDTYCNWATCFVEGIMQNTFGEVYSSTILRINDEHVAFQSGHNMFRVDLKNNYDTEYEKCICWELSILHNNEFEKLYSGYSVIDTYKCEVVDCIMN